MTRLGFGALPVKDVFRVLDEDGSGVIDIRELVAGLSTLREGGERAIRLAFDVYDTDGDGA